LRSDLLEEGGYQVCEAVDGADASRVAERELPAAIIMNLVMTNVNGAEACPRLRANPLFRFPRS
jgi:CheY-like chemotaxis protein